jgi:hypothetical protein
VVMDEEGVASATASLTKASILSRWAMASASWAECGGVSSAEGCEECNECAVVESGLMSIGACAVGELRTIVNPGGSIVSWPPKLGSSPCTSLVATCPGIGTEMVAVPVALDSAVGMLTVAVSYILPASPSIVLPCSVSLRTGSRWCLSNPMDSCWDIAVVGVNPTAYPTPPSSC